MLFLKWRGGFGFGVGVGTNISNLILITVLAFGYRGKPEPEPIPGQLGYYSSMSGWIRMGTNGYRFYCHV